MLSRCWCITRSSAWSQSKYSLNSLCVRNHHVIASPSTWTYRTEKNETQSPNSPLTKVILQRISAPGFAPQRNFSVIPGVLASGGSAGVSASPSASATTTAATATPLQIPEVPAPVEETFVQLAANGEPTFASLGLGGYSPIGLLQNALEFVHVSLDLPWYATIALSTVIIRMLLTPLFVITQKNAAVMRNVMPEMQEVQSKLTEARQMGNAVEYAQANQELMALMKDRGFNPLKNMLIPFAQMPIFLSYFIGIRRMVNAPVESLHTGGIWWFTDLTLADPYYILPIVCSATLALTIHFGTEVSRIPGQDSPVLLYVLKALPIVIFPFIMNFPAAMVVYWASSNFCSLVQGSIFRLPKVRTFFNIPQVINHPMVTKTKKKSGVVDNVKGAWSNLKMSREIEDRRRLDQINFERAGTGPLVRTYKFDPTKVKKSN